MSVVQGVASDFEVVVAATVDRTNKRHQPVDHALAHGRCQWEVESEGTVGVDTRVVPGADDASLRDIPPLVSVLAASVAALVDAASAAVAAAAVAAAAVVVVVATTGAAAPAAVKSLHWDRT